MDAANSVCFVPVRLGVRPIGSLGISGTMLSRQTLEAMGTLIAMAMEHARAIEQLGQTEAAREGEQSAHRVARCRDPCVAHAAYLDQSLRDQFALESDID